MNRFSFDIKKLPFYLQLEQLIEKFSCYEKKPQVLHKTVEIFKERKSQKCYCRYKRVRSNFNLQK